MTYFHDRAVKNKTIYIFLLILRFTKARSKREALDEIIRKNEFRHTQSEDNLVMIENKEIMINNLVTKETKKMKL